MFFGEFAHPVDVRAEVAFEAAEANVGSDFDDPAAGVSNGLAQREDFLCACKRTGDRFAVHGPV